MRDLEGRRKKKSPLINKGWITSKILTNLSFAIMTYIHCVVIMAFNFVSVHLVPHATDIGISPTSSATALGLMGGFSVPGRIIAGLISDRIDWQKILALSCFGMALSMLFCLFLRGIFTLYCFVLFFGLFHGSRMSAHVGILGEFFGTRSLGELIGITSAIGMLIGAFSPYIAGFIFDNTGGYFIAFLIAFVILLSSGIFASIMAKEVEKE